MDETTARKLNRLTRRFYEGSAGGFIAGREMPWPGWLRLLQLRATAFGQTPRITVLDVGCGNGRFCRCLQQHLGHPFRYLGLDSSPRLIALARARLATIADARCEVCDLVEGGADLAGGRFSLVAAFGLLHHIPSYRRRRRLVEQLCQSVERGGALALSTWRLQSEELARRKRVPWAQAAQRTGEAIAASQIESGDQLIAKPGGRPRYCHWIDSAEEERLFAGLPLRLVTAFDADGSAVHLNRYFLLCES